MIPGGGCRGEAAAPRLQAYGIGGGAAASPGFRRLQHAAGGGAAAGGQLQLAGFGSVRLPEVSAPLLY